MTHVGGYDAGNLHGSVLMGYYSLLAFNANAFEIDVPAGGTEPQLPI